MTHAFCNFFSSNTLALHMQSLMIIYLWTVQHIKQNFSQATLCTYSHSHRKLTRCVTWPRNENRRVMMRDAILGDGVPMAAPVLNGLLPLAEAVQRFACVVVYFQSGLPIRGTNNTARTWSLAATQQIIWSTRDVREDLCEDVLMIIKQSCLQKHNGNIKSSCHDQEVCEDVSNITWDLLFVCLAKKNRPSEKA